MIGLPPYIKIAHYTFEYAVKFLLGELQPDPYGPVAAGYYRTAINVHNPNPPKDEKGDVNVNIRKKVVLALTELNRDRKQPSEWTIVEPLLLSDFAFEIDYKDIINISHGIVPTTGFNKGFVVIQSDYELDVVAVYTTSQKMDAPVSNLVIERVPYRSVNYIGFL